MASSKTKNIYEIDDIAEMVQAMMALDIPFKGLKTLDDMKARVKAELHQSAKTPSWTAGQAFCVLSEAKDEDVRKRQILLDLYSKAERCLDKMDQTILSLLQQNMGKFNEKLNSHKFQLTHKEYFLLVAGETSSGKSSLVNLILGEELLPYSVLSTTSTICEMKYGEERRIVAHFKDKDPVTGLPTKTILLKEHPTTEQHYLQQISPYVHMENEREKGSIYKKIELFWPHSLLQKGVVIIDSPGVGESEIMDEIVTQYLPQAFAFIYTINSANAGGVQKDRLEKLMEEVKKVSDMSVEQGQKMELPSKCALFVCNKWDQVPENEVQAVKNHVIRKLQRCWPGLDPESQIIYMSTMKASKGQNLGFVTEDFLSLMNGLRVMVLKSIDIKLEMHWKWLYYLLSRIIYQAKAFVMNASKDRQVVLCKIGAILIRLGQIETQQGKVTAELNDYLEDHVNNAMQQLTEYLSSDEIKARFTSWTLDEVPKVEKSWEVTENQIIKALTRRLRDIIEHWEEDNQVFASAVYVGKMKRFGGNLMPVALKVFNDVLAQTNASDIMAEVELLRKLEHSHIVKFYGTSLLKTMDTIRVILVMEKCKENLKSRIFEHPESIPGKSGNSAVVREVCRWAKEITAALDFIHKQGVVHRDLKLENILLTEDNSVKISDVGVSKPVTDITGTMAGTAVYFAPEVFHCEVYGCKADIYSLGIVLWEMWYGEQAFSNVLPITTNAFFRFVDDGHRPEHVQGCKQPPHRWEELMGRCWECKPEKRPEAKECLVVATLLFKEVVSPL